LGPLNIRPVCQRVARILGLRAGPDVGAGTI
jgi:hypothetical protein